MTDAPVTPKSLKPPKWLILLISIPLSCGLLCGFLYWMAELRPQYIELSEPPIEHYIGGRYTKRTILEWEDTRNRYYIWQQEGFCSKSECGDRTQVIEQIDRWLDGLGWQREGREGNCLHVTEETERLKTVGKNILVYRLKSVDESVYTLTQVICIGIWDSLPDDGYLNLIIATRNAGLLTQLRDAFTD